MAVVEYRLTWVGRPFTPKEKGRRQVIDRIYYSKEAANLARRQQVVGNLAFLMLGLGAGATLALLFAPETGGRTRELVTHALEEGFDRGREAAEEALHHLEQEYPDAYEKVRTSLLELRN